MPNQHKPKRIKTTKTAFEIIEYVKSNTNTTLSQMATDIDISKSTLHTHLQTLCEMDYLVQSGDEYRMGLPFLTLGGHVQQTDPYGKLYRVGSAEIDDLAEETGERAQLVVEEGGRGYHLYQSIGDRAVYADTHSGTQIPLYSTAVGKAMLASMPDDRVSEILSEQSFEAHTPNTITSRDQLVAEIEQVAERGYAIDREERIPGIYCIGAAIELDRNDVYSAVSVSLPKKRAHGEYFEEKIPEMVTNSAQIIGLNSTYS